MTLTAFESEVLKKVSQVPAGRVTTYKLLAKACRRPKAWRAVGLALKKNPQLVKIPCHRVVASDGRLGGYQKGARRKIRLLKREGVAVVDGQVKNFKSKIFKL